MTALRTTLLAAAGALALAGPLRAEEAADAKAGAKAAAGADARSDKAEKGRPAQRKVLRLEEFTVEGRIQKPQAFFILQRSNLSFDGGDRKETFLPKIQKSCEKEPF